MVMNNPESEIKHKLVINIKKSEDLFFDSKTYIAWKVALLMTSLLSPAFKKKKKISKKINKKIDLMLPSE